MATDKRLERLGLSHLANQPELLEAELASRLAKRRQAEDSWVNERETRKFNKRKPDSSS